MRRGWTKPGLEAWLCPTMMELAWAAGVYEGEGSCHSGRGIDACVVQNDRWLLDKIRELFGGSIRVRHNYKSPQAYEANSIYPKTVREMFIWSCSGARARGFLMTIYAFLSPKRQLQIRMALDGAIYPRRPYVRRDQ